MSSLWAVAVVLGVPVLWGRALSVARIHDLPWDDELRELRDVTEEQMEAGRPTLVPSPMLLEILDERRRLMGEIRDLRARARELTERLSDRESAERSSAKGPRLRAEDCLREVCARWGVSRDDLLGQRRSRDLNRARYAAVHLLVHSARLRYEDAARLLGRSRGALYLSIRRAGGMVAQGDLAPDVEAIVAQLGGRARAETRPAAGGSVVPLARRRRMRFDDARQLWLFGQEAA